MKLGRNPSPQPATFKLARYVDVERIAAKLPTVPRNFGHEAGVPFQIFGNDAIGDCVCAGAGNETLLTCKAGSHPVAMVEANVIRMYSDITGYTPSDPNSDQGTDMVAAAKYRQKHGLVDSEGVVHRIGAYLAITPGDLTEHLVAMYLFGAVGLGITVTQRTMKQFEQGLYWSMAGQKGSPAEGGHYIPAVARRGIHIDVVTWAKLQPVTDAFLKTFEDEALAYVMPEMLDATGHTPEGFDLDTLT